MDASDGQGLHWSWRQSVLLLFLSGADTVSSFSHQFIFPIHLRRAWPLPSIQTHFDYSLPRLHEPPVLT